MQLWHAYFNSILRKTTTTAFSCLFSRHNFHCPMEDHCYICVAFPAAIASGVQYMLNGEKISGHRQTSTSQRGSIGQSVIAVVVCVTNHIHAYVKQSIAQTPQTGWRWFIAAVVHVTSGVVRWKKQKILFRALEKWFCNKNVATIKNI